MTDFASAASAALNGAGISMRRAARELNYDVAYLSRVLNAKQQPSGNLAKGLDRLLNLDGELATLAAASTPPGQSASAATLAALLPVDDALTGGHRNGRRIGADTADGLAGRVHGLRLADDVLAGGDLIGPVFRELQAAVRLYRESSYSEDVGRALLVQIGELGQIAGWIASDAGRHEQAERAYRLGISAAREAGESTLVGNLAGSLAYQLSNTGHTAEGVQMARAALEEAGPTAHPTARALFWDRVAWAQAQAGQAQRAMTALAEAHQALTTEAENDAPQWAYWVCEDELRVMDARVYTELRRPLRAVPVLTDVLGSYDATHGRELALYLSWLVVALADANEPEEAAAAAARALGVSDQVASERTSERSRVMLRRLQPYRDLPEVRRLLAEHGHRLAGPRA